MKKTILLLVVLSVFTFGAFASFSGRTGVGLNYSYNDSKNYFGLTSDSIGFVNNGPVGYFASVDASFNFKDTKDWRVGMLVGPAYRYTFDDVNVSIEAAIGVSAAFNTPENFNFGLGGYIGAAWHAAELFDVTLGAKLGSNFVDLNTSTGGWGVSGDFYVVPALAIGFKY